MTHNGSPVLFPLAFKVADDQPPCVLAEVFDSPTHTTIYWQSGAVSTEDKPHTADRLREVLDGTRTDYTSTTLEAILAEWQPLHDAIVVPDFPFIITTGKKGSFMAVEYLSEEDYITYSREGEPHHGKADGRLARLARNTIGMATGCGILEYMTREELIAAVAAAKAPPEEPSGRFPIYLKALPEVSDSICIAILSPQRAVEYKTNGARYAIYPEAKALIFMLALIAPPEMRTTHQEVMERWQPARDAIPKIPYPFVVDVRELPGASGESEGVDLLAVECTSLTEAVGYLSDGDSSPSSISLEKNGFDAEDLMVEVHLGHAPLISRAELEDLRTAARAEQLNASTTITE